MDFLELIGLKQKIISPLPDAETNGIVSPVSPSTMQEMIARQNYKEQQLKLQQQPLDNNTIPGYARETPEEQLAKLIIESANAKNIPPAMVAAILYNESGINPNVATNTGIMENGQISNDRGMAQISDLAYPNITDQQAQDPNFAIPFVADTLAKNLKYFNNDYGRAAAAYNVGRGGASVQGPEPYGGGPRGQNYIDKLIQNLTPEYQEKYKIKSRK